MRPRSNGDRPTTRARLLEATLAALDEKGYAAIRVDDVAQQAGVTSGAIYGLFPSKAELLASALRQRSPQAADAAAAKRRYTRVEREVLGAAMEVLDAKGYRRTRLADVVRGLDRSAKDAAARFGGKDGLLIASLAAHDPDLLAALRRAADDDVAGGSTVSTTDRLVAATLAVLDESQHRAATVGEIARRAGLTTGAIYARFGSKEELINAALSARYEGMFRSALDEVEGAGASEGVLGALGSILATEAGYDHRSVMEVLAAASRGEAIRPNVQGLMQRRQHVIASLVDQGKGGGQIAPDVPTAALAHTIQLLALGNAVGQAIGLSAPDPDDFRDVIERLGTGLAPRTAGDASPR